MYAIVKTGSKQYKVVAGDVIKVEKIDGKVGDKINLETIFTSADGKVSADPKAASQTKVVGEIVEQFKDKKVIVFKFKKRKNYQRKVGHRQQMTKLKIVSVGDEKAKADKKTSTKTSKTASATKKTSAKKTTAAASKGKAATASSKTSASTKKTTAAAKKTTASKKTTTASKTTTTSKKATTAKKATSTTKKSATTKKAASTEKKGE